MSTDRGMAKYTKSICTAQQLRIKKQCNKTRHSAPVAHACNPSYSEDRDQEDSGSKSAWGNSLQDPILKTLITEKGWVELLPSKLEALS
jgi:hypothetical protein